MILKFKRAQFFRSAPILLSFFLAAKGSNNGFHENRQIIRHAAGDQVAVNDDLLVHPAGPGVNQIIFNRVKGSRLYMGHFTDVWVFQ